MAYLRFSQGERAAEGAIRNAIEEGTRYSMGGIRYLHTVSELPDALR